MVDTHSERTLRFDLLAVELGEVRGHQVRLEFYTVPGQSYYAATRRAVLAGADGVVFVADSRREALDENIEAMNEMLNNLRHHGLPEDLPVVVQYNKQDLPTALKREQLEPLMNVRGWPSQSSVAIDGNGVMETMKQISGLVLDRAQRSTAIPDAAAPAPAPRAGSWLISCYRCQAMLEVPDAKPGSVYACGICGSPLEVTDADRGLTCPPTAQGTPAGQRSLQRDDTGYGMQALGDQQGGALGAPTPTTQTPAASGGAPYEVTGYDLLAPLDESVQGRRSRVRERSTGRSLRALSVSSALFRQPGYREGLEPYVRLASQVKHPYILPLTGLSPTKEAAVLFSADPPDYEPLGHILARRRALAPPHAMGIVRQLALALEEASRHGVVHGWLRPEAVMVSPDGNVLLDELALAKNHRFLVRELSGASAATEYYLAPEHLTEEIRSDVRSDMFMLGALLFRMLTGEGLVTGYNAHEALHKIVANGARTLRSMQSGVSRDLDLFYQRLVATERKDRFQSYRELIDTLDKFGGGAKRQTLRLTQSVPASPGTGQVRRGGTGQIRRTGGTAQLRRVGTSELPRGLGGTSTTRRAQPRSGEYQTGSVRKREPQGSGSAVGIVVVIALILGAGFCYFMLNSPSPGRLPSQPGSAPTPPPAPPSPAPSASTPSPRATPSATPRPEVPNAKPPSWLTPGTAAPATTAATAPAATASPAPPINGAIDVTPEARPVTDPNDRIGVVLQIAELERAHRFKAAMDACERMPSADEKQAKILGVVAAHDRARQDVEGKVAASKSIAEVAALLKPALTTWGLPGDEEWAKGLLAGAETRLGKAPADTVAAQPGTAPAPATADPSPAKAGDLERIASLDGQINQALANNNQGLALQNLGLLDAGAPETAAIKRKIAIWGKRGEILGRVIAERAPKLRVPHPTTNEMWDISSTSVGGISVASPAGSKTDLTWNQVTVKDLARVCMEAASAPGTKPDEHALATVMLLISGDTVMASVQLKKAKGVIEPDVGADLETVIGLQRRRDALDLVTRAKDAAKNGNGRLLGECIDQLKRLDKSLQPLVAEELPRLEELRKQVGGGSGPSGESPVANASKDRDHLGFDSPEELKAFSERAGTWQVANGQLANAGDGCRIQRKDLKDGRSVHLIFQSMAQRGAMIVDFRGVRLVIDFGSNTYQAISREETLKSKPFTFLPKASNSLYFEVKQPNNFVSIEVNNGADSMGIKGGDLSDNFGIGLDSGALVAIDELQISRGAPTVSIKDKQAEMRKLGLDPLGSAFLEAPTIVLPALAGGLSGVAMPIKDNIVGATFEAKGTGSLRIQLGNPNDRSGQWIDVPIGSVATAFKITWNNSTLTVSDGVANTLGTVALSGGHSHLILYALQEAVLLSTPRLTYQ
jgi:hypothetical protein